VLGVLLLAVEEFAFEFAVLLGGVPARARPGDGFGDEPVALAVEQEFGAGADDIDVSPGAGGASVAGSPSRARSTVRS
jgi:hypothetical protein